MTRLKTIVQVLFFFILCFVGMIGAFGLLTVILVQITEHKQWIAHLKVLMTFGSAVIIWWLWWRFNILGCRGAADQFLMRAGQAEKRWRETSATYRVIVLIGTIATMVNIIIQSSNLRNLIHEKPVEKPRQNSVVTTNAASTR